MNDYQNERLARAEVEIVNLKEALKTIFEKIDSIPRELSAIINQRFERQEKRDDDLNLCGRVEKIENWKIRMGAISAIISLVVAAVVANLGFIFDFLGK